MARRPGTVHVASTNTQGRGEPGAGSGICAPRSLSCVQDLHSLIGFVTSFLPPAPALSFDLEVAKMSSWLVAALGGGGALSGLFALIRHRMNLRFYRDIAEHHGLKGLDAAARATHPAVEAVRRRQSDRATRALPPLRAPGQPPDESPPMQRALS